MQQEILDVYMVIKITQTPGEKNNQSIFINNVWSDVICLFKLKYIFMKIFSDQSKSLNNKMITTFNEIQESYFETLP